MSDPMNTINYQHGGEIFIDLAMGRRAIPSNDDQVAVKELCAEFGANFSDGETVLLHRDTDTVFNFVIRNATSIGIREAEVKKDNGEYAFPEEVDVTYRKFFDPATADTFEGPTGKAKRLELFHKHVGDYTFGNCM